MTVVNWGLWLIPISFYFSWQVYRCNRIAAAVLSLVTCNFVYVLFLKDYSSYQLFDRMAFKQMASVGYACFLLFTMAAISTFPNNSKRLLLGVAWWCFLSSFYVIVNAFVGLSAFDRGGFLGNASMLACGIAVSYPILYSHLKKMYFDGILFWSALILPIAAVGLLGTSMGYGVLATVLSVLLLHSSKNAIAALLSVYGGALATGYFMMGSDFFSSSGRFTLWGHALNWQWEKGNIILGQGIGSAPIWLPHIQKINRFDRGSWFVQMHNDWIQIFFELGAIGLIICGLVYMVLLHNSISNKFLNASVLGFGVFMMGNFPLHWPMYAALGTIIGLAAYQEVPHEVDATYPA